MLTARILRQIVPPTLVVLGLLSPTHALTGAWSRRAAALRDAVSKADDMRIARMAHTATTLPDGRVLVLGGFTNEGDAARSAESYEPKAGHFHALPRMLGVRHSHSATVLPNGKVLIVGGYGAGSATLSSAELFDPKTNAFASTGSLRSARAGHVAVLLASGKVLIAGGIGPEWTFLSSAELYDPATGNFSPTGAMSVARESHVGVRLQDGRVLVVGGHRGRRADITLYTSAETYDPTTGTFKRVGDMHTRRHKHDGVALRDGRVLITGGSDERDDRGAYDSSELFDPTTGTFTVGPTMQRARYKHNGSSILLPDGNVLIAGGAAQAEVFNPVTATFTLVAGDSPLTGQFSAVAPFAPGRVLITGGYGPDRGPQDKAWIYRP